MHINAFIWNLENVTDEFICKVRIETHAEKRVDTARDGERGTN